MTGLVVPLEWDTAFFGFPIGRIALDGLEPAQVAEAVREADAGGIRCVYGSLDPTGLDLVHPVQQLGFRLVDVVMDLDRRERIGPMEDRPPTRSVARQGSPDDLPALEEEIAKLAPWSRYSIDPRFGADVARRMHRAWVERAARGDDGRLLIVAEDESGVTGFSTQTSVDAAEPRIDLIASSKPGSGAAQALVAFAEDLFGPRPSWGGPIAARNVASLRFCENMGYRIASTTYLFHRWADEC